MNRLVSVIVPVFRVEKYLPKCIESIIAQDYPSLEIILVDDCSDDNSGSICDFYSNNYNNIITVHLSANFGQAVARNEGIKISSGGYIVFVDPDDYVEKKYVSALVELIERFDADIATSLVIREYENAPKKEIVRNKEPYFLDSKAAIEETYFNNHITWSPCGKVFKKEIFENVLFRNVRKHEDFYSMIDFFSQAKRVAIDDCLDLYHYVYHTESTTTFFSKESLSILDISDEIASKTELFVHEHRIVLAELYRKVLLVLLNLNELSNSEFKMIFLLKRRYLRKNLGKYLMQKDIQCKRKLSYFALCTTPAIYKFLRSFKGE